MYVLRKNKTIQNDQKGEKSFFWRESNPGPSTCKINALSIAPQQLMWNKVVKLIILTFLPVKFCQWTLFEAGRALVMKNWKIYSRKTGMVLTV